MPAPRPARLSVLSARGWHGKGRARVFPPTKMPDMSRSPSIRNRAAIRRIIELMDQLGKTVTAVEQSPDDTFCVMTAEHRRGPASNLDLARTFNKWKAKKFA